MQEIRRAALFGCFMFAIASGCAALIYILAPKYFESAIDIIPAWMLATALGYYHGQRDAHARRMLSEFRRSPRQGERVHS